METAKAYDNLFSVFEKAYKIQSKLISSALHYPPSKIYDICCGSGVFTQYISSEFSNAQIIGVDIDPSCLQMAASKLGPPHEFTLGDAVHFVDQLRLEPGALILLRGCLHLLHPIRLAELLKLLGRQTTIVIGERTALSASTYLLPSLAKKRLMYLTSQERQKEFLCPPDGFSVKTCCGGAWGTCKTSRYLAAVAHKSMSYVNGCTTQEIDLWRKDCAKPYISIFDEYRYFFYVKA